VFLLTATPRILIVAGSDSGGGAGIQADIKTATMLGGYAMTAVTAITVQNTLGVHAIHAVPPTMVGDQMRVVLSDLGADAIKIGMLGSPELIEVVAEILDTVPDIPVILDPVMIAKGGAPLMEGAGVAALKARLISRAFLMTPNLPEAAELTGLDAEQSPQEAALALVAMGARNVLIKGGHGSGERLVDLLVLNHGTSHPFESERIATRHTHGTGCTMATAIATLIGGGERLPEAVRQARDYVRGAILHAPGFGAGHGPLDHGWMLR
jgi:hydroxymethylpyrimidine/phosphomethylpyrimidine kinase